LVCLMAPESGRNGCEYENDGIYSTLYSSTVAVQQYLEHVL
jgi:hypothetical protein